MEITFYRNEALIRGRNAFQCIQLTLTVLWKAHKSGNWYRIKTQLPHIWRKEVPLSPLEYIIQPPLFYQFIHPPPDLSWSHSIFWSTNSTFISCYLLVYTDGNTRLTRCETSSQRRRRRKKERSDSWLMLLSLNEAPDVPHILLQHRPRCPFIHQHWFGLRQNQTLVGGYRTFEADGHALSEGPSDQVPGG